jgi:hypothetical protein
LAEAERNSVFSGLAKALFFVFAFQWLKPAAIYSKTMAIYAKTITNYQALFLVRHLEQNQRKLPLTE